MTAQNWGYETECQIDGATVWGSGPPGSSWVNSYAVTTFSVCLTEGTHTLALSDSYGDGWHGGYVTILGVRYGEDFSSGHGPVEYTFLVGLPGPSPPPAIVCPCLTAFPSDVTFDSDGNLPITIDGVSYAYPPTYGLDQCFNHDERLPPFCDTLTADGESFDPLANPSWCVSNWCYVDPTNCDAETTLGSYLPTVSYSYEACGATNEFSDYYSLFRPQMPPSPSMPPSPPPPPSPPSMPPTPPPIDCPCLTAFPSDVIFNSDGSLPVRISGTDYSYGITYGLSQCSTHDAGTEPFCDTFDSSGNFDPLANPAWCSSSWCYVSPEDCNVGTAASEFLVGADMAYSYAACEASNSFSDYFLAVQPRPPPTPPPSPAAPCIERLAGVDTTTLDFANAEVVYSNLGGPGPPSGGEGPPSGMRLGNVGTLSDGTVIDLEVTNTSQYRAWVSSASGLNPNKFGVVNLRAPGIVDLRFTFLNAATNAPLVLPRTHISFYDFDQDGRLPNGWQNDVRECMQARGGITGTTLTANTQIEEYQLDANALIGGTPHENTYVRTIIAALGAENVWDTSDEATTGLFCSTQDGAGPDNPTSPRALTRLQRSRSVMLTIEGVSSFEVRVSARARSWQRAATGRNFLFAGNSNELPYCPTHVGA